MADKGVARAFIRRPIDGGERPPWRSILTRMATAAAPRPAWNVKGRSLTRTRLLTPLGLAALMLLALALRTTEMGIGFWIDEGLSVGIADRPLSDIPGILRLDGSPPFYYVLLHVWMSVFGTTEEATRAALAAAFSAALRDGADGPNGVYRYGSGGGFPTQTFESSNYWVDLTFTPAS